MKTGGQTGSRKRAMKEEKDNRVHVEETETGNKNNRLSMHIMHKLETAGEGGR